MALIAPTGIRGQHSRVRVKRPSERRSRSRSATRALDLLELFGSERRELRAVEIAKALMLHPSTTNQLLKTMVDSGHLVFDARRKSYLPSPRLIQFSGWLLEAYSGGGRLRELLRDVQSRTGMIVTLATANDLFMQVIDLVAPVGFTTERGLRISLFGSAIGSAYLSMLDDREVKRLALRARLPRSEMGAMLTAVERIRQDGCADGETAGGKTWSIAVPLPIEGLRVPTVLGLAGPAQEVQSKLPALRQTMFDSIARWLKRA